MQKERDAISADLDTEFSNFDQELKKQTDKVLEAQITHSKMLGLVSDNIKNETLKIAEQTSKQGGLVRILAYLASIGVILNIFIILKLFLV